MEPGSEKTFYQFLKVDPSANLVLIRYASRLLLAEYDLDQSFLGDAIMYERVAKIWAILSDAELRPKYDRALQEAGLWNESFSASMAEKCAEINDNLLTAIGDIGVSLSEVEVADDKQLFELAAGYSAQIVCRMALEHAGRFTRLTINPNNLGRSSGIFFLLDQSVWTFDRQGVQVEYARVRNNEKLVGLCFNSDNDLCVVGDDGTLCWISPNKSGRTIFQSYASPSSLTFDHAQKILFVALPDEDDCGIVLIDKDESERVLLSEAGIQGLLWDCDKTLLYFVPATGYLTRIDMEGNIVARMFVAEPANFSNELGVDGNLARDSEGNIYVTAHKLGAVFRVTPDERSEIFVSKLDRPAGLATAADGTLYILESGCARVIRITNNAVKEPAHML